MRKFLAPISRQTLSAIWHFFPANRKAEVDRLASAFERSKFLIHVIHPNDEVAESLLQEAARKYAALGNPWETRGESAEGLKVPLQSAQAFQVFTFEVLNDSEQFQEAVWLADAAQDTKAFQELYDQSGFSPYLKDALLESPAWQQSLDEYGMVARYVKHLVFLTFEYSNVKRVLMGVPRLAYRYTNQEMHHLAAQVETNATASDWNKSFSKIRNKLIEELCDRFGSLVRVVKDPQMANEKCFDGQLMDQISQNHRTANLAVFVARCLEIFAPWAIRLPVTPPSTKLLSHLQKLAKKTPHHSTASSQLIMNFALLHPDVFQQIVSEEFSGHPGVLPTHRLALPIFQVPANQPGSGGVMGNTGGSNNSNDNWHWRFGPSQPEEPEGKLVETIRNTLVQDDTRRKSYAGGPLTVIVGGKKVGMIASLEKPSGSFHFKRNVRLIELRATDANGEFPLLTFWLDAEEVTQTWLKHKSYRVELINGQSVWLHFRLKKEDGRDSIELQFEFTPQASPKPAFGLNIVTRPVLAGVVVILLLVACMWIWRRPSPNPSPIANDPPKQVPPPTQVPNPEPSPMPQPPDEKQVHQTPQIPKPAPRQKPRLVLPEGKTELEKQYWKRVRDELAVIGTWKVTSRKGQDIFELSQDATLSGTESVLRVELYDSYGNLKWYKSEVLTEMNIEEKARATAQELSRLKMK